MNSIKLLSAILKFDRQDPTNIQLSIVNSQFYDPAIYFAIPAHNLGAYSLIKCLIPSISLGSPASSCITSSRRS
jgi:hypothetical protein